MEVITHALTQTEILLESDMLGTLIGSYLFLFYVLFVAFVNIHSIDKYEFLGEKQTLLTFKRKLIFVINYSKNKRVISKKTLLLEIIAYSIVLVVFTIFVVSLFLWVTLAVVLLVVSAVVVFAHGIVMSELSEKAKKTYESRPIRYDDDD